MRSFREELRRDRVRGQVGMLDRCGCKRRLDDILTLSEAELEEWVPKIAAIRDSGVATMMPDWPAAAATVEIGTLDVVGDSHISEFGPSVVDYGIAQKVAGNIRPAQLRVCALGGSTHAWANQGNGTLGDGGHFHIATEYDRQEQSGSAWNSTITQTVGSGVTSITANAGAGGSVAAGQWVVLGKGTQTEVIQLSQTWNGASPLIFATSTTQAHTTGDPVYHAMRNEGYLAKSQLVVLCAEGANDVGVTGPGAPPNPLSGSWQQGTFGTTLGASRGHMPFMHTLRFTIANLRCAVIYKDTHPNIIYAAAPGTWTSTAQTSALSYPPISAFGGNAGNVHTATVNGSTLSFSTAQDFPGGTVVVFTRSGASGQGAIWDYAVSGATTVATTSHAAGGIYDDRNIGALYQNMASGVGTLTTGSAFRITGLNAGLNTITLTATTIGTIATFLGWGIEAPSPPLIMAICPARVPGVPGTAGPGAAYNVRPRAATGATVTGAPSTTVTFTGGTVALGTIGTPANTAQINDTITLDKGNAALEETRRVTGYTGSPATACTVDSAFLNNHTASTFVLGLQDADYVGGGYLNAADTQGAASVPGCAAVITSVCNEFDSNVVPVLLDLVVNTLTTVNPLNFYSDGIHFNDQGSGLIAAAVTQAILAKLPSIPTLMTPTVPNKRTFQAVYGDAGATPAASSAVQVFVNSWSNVFSSAFPSPTNYPRTGYYKDLRTRDVAVRGATLGNVGTGTTIFTLPVGYRPSGLTPLRAYSLTTGGVFSLAIVTVDAAGLVVCRSTIVTTSALVFAGTFPAEG